jgi:hypothetical protein
MAPWKHPMPPFPQEFFEEVRRAKPVQSLVLVLGSQRQGPSLQEDYAVALQRLEACLTAAQG